MLQYIFWNIGPSPTAREYWNSVRDITNKKINAKNMLENVYLQKIVKCANFLFSSFFAWVKLGSLQLKQHELFVVREVYSHLWMNSSPRRQQWCKHWESLHRTHHPVERKHTDIIPSLHLQHPKPRQKWFRALLTCRLQMATVFHKWLSLWYCKHICESSTGLLHAHAWVTCWN